MRHDPASAAVVVMLRSLKMYGMSFARGEAYQFDWSHDVVLINGTTVTVKVAHERAQALWHEERL